MSKLKELMKKLCPNGVEYKALGELGKFYGGITGKSKEDFKDGNAKWLGLFIESDEFARVAAQNGLTINQIKTYIIGHTLKQHAEELAKKNPVAMFIDKNKITKECFELRHKFIESGADKNEDYDI